MKTLREATIALAVLTVSFTAPPANAYPQPARAVQSTGPFTPIPVQRTCTTTCDRYPPYTCRTTCY